MLSDKKMNEKSAERPNTSLYEKIEESEEPPKPKEMIAKRRMIIKYSYSSRRLSRNL